MAISDRAIDGARRAADAYGDFLFPIGANVHIGVEGRAGRAGHFATGFAIIAYNTMGAYIGTIKFGLSILGAYLSDISRALGYTGLGAGASALAQGAVLAHVVAF